MTDGQTEYQFDCWVREREALSRTTKGMRAFWQGLLISDCPYPEGSLDEGHWLRGWELGRQQKIAGG